MSKIELPTVTSGYNLSAINNNFKKIEDTLNKEVLYRKEYLGEPNEMQTNLDMNGKQILNVATGTSDGSLVTKWYVDQGLALKFDKSGGPLSGPIDMGNNEILNTSRLSTDTLEIGGVPVVPTDLAIYYYNETREALRRSYAEAGYNLVDGSFEAGGTLVNANDVLLQELTGKAFSGPAGTVAAGTAPTSGRFVDRSAETLRHELALNTGAGMVATADGRTVQESFDNILAEVDAVGTAAAALISQHNSSSAAHPELSAFISAEANRAEAAAGSVKPYVDGALSDLSTAANKFYPTLAEANADIANINVNQPVTVGEVVNGGLWYKATAGATTLTKSAYDPLTQAKNYTDTVTPKLTLIASAISFLQGYYVSVDTKTLNTNASTYIAHVPVRPGTTYDLYSSSYLSTAFDGIYVNNMTEKTKLAGFSYTIVSGNNAKFTVPSNIPDGAILILNAVIPSVAFDIRATLNISVANNAVFKINGFPIEDTTARTEIKRVDSSFAVKKVLSELATTGYFTDTDYYNSANNISGKYVNVYGGVIGSAGGVILTSFEVKEGVTYFIESADFNTQGFAACLKVTNDLATADTLGKITLSDTSDTSVKSFTVPLGSTAKYCYLNVLIPSVSFDIRTSLKIYSNAKFLDVVYAKGEVPLYDEFSAKRLAQLKTEIDNINRESSSLKGKKWCVIGDSITEVNFRTTHNYHYYVAENVGGMTVYNYGISGSGFYNRSGVAATISQSDIDIITVFLGTNDYGNVGTNNKALGVFGDTGTTTVSGCINTLLSGLLSRFPTKPIAILTPLPRFENWGSNAAANSQGYTLEQLVELIRTYAKHYSLPVLDLYHESNLPVWVDAGNRYYFTAPGNANPDGLHPNDAGHNIIAKKVQKFLESI